MRILQIHKFHWLAGGVERYLFDLSALLESHGHEVIHFSMHDSRNRPCAQSDYFVSNLHFGVMGPAAALRNASRVLGGTVYSFEARDKLAALIRDLRPDIAHLHLIEHHLSPSVLGALRDARVPVVQTAHEYKLVCPNYQLYVPRTGELCERCLPGKYYHCVLQRCMKDSVAASALAAGSKYLHRARGTFEKNVNTFLYATEFVGQKLEQGGIPAEKLRHLPLYIDLARFRSTGQREEYIAYAGRLVPEKGLRTLFSAMCRLPDVSLRLLGDGPMRPELERLAQDWGLKNIQFFGFLDQDEYVAQLSGARALVLPSELYETCGLVIWEASALGVPAIASRIGGIPESIDDGESGVLFEPGNADELADKIRSMLSDPTRATTMAARGAEKVRANCGAHYARIHSVYEAAIAEARA